MGQGVRLHKTFFLVNAYAGGGKAKGWWLDMLPQLERQGLNFFWAYSKGRQETAQQVRQAVLDDGATAVVVVGGDGSLHDCLNGLVAQDALIKPDVLFGAYPAGSACDFTRMIYARRGDTSFMTLLLEGEVRQIDIGRCDFYALTGEPRQAYFLNGSDIGLGANACAAVNAAGGLIKRLTRNGPLSFLLAVIQALFRYRYLPMEVEADGEKIPGRYLIAGAGNGRYMGGNMCLFPQAQLDDGLLDLLLVEKMHIPNVLRVFSRVYSGRLPTVKQVRYRQARRIKLAPQSPMQLELDGELLGYTPATMQVLPALLPLLVFAPATTPVS